MGQSYWIVLSPHPVGPNMTQTNWQVEGWCQQGSLESTLQMLYLELNYLQLPAWQLEMQAPTEKLDLHEGVLQHLGKGCLELGDA